MRNGTRKGLAAAYSFQIVVEKTGAEWWQILFLVCHKQMAINKTFLIEMLAKAHASCCLNSTLDIPSLP